MKVREVIKKVEEGLINPLDAFVDLSLHLKEVEEALYSIKYLAISEAEKYPEKVIQFKNATVEKRNGPSKWDFSACSAIVNAELKLKNLKELAKLGGVDPDTGEYLVAKKIEGSPILVVKEK